MDQVQVKVIDAQPRETGFNLAKNVEAGKTPIIRPFAYGVGDLRAQKQLIPDRGTFGLEPPTDIRFAPPPAIGIGGVKEVDPQVPRRVH